MLSAAQNKMYCIGRAGLLSKQQLCAGSPLGFDFVYNVLFCFSQSHTMPLLNKLLNLFSYHCMQRGAYNT